MKRREFLVAAGGVTAGAFTRFSSAATACPPNYLVSQGGGIATTPCVTGSAPLWYTAMADNTWSHIAITQTIDSVKPSPHPGGVAQSNGPLVAWNGAAVDTLRQELQIGAQGGHGDYYGNEMYVLALNVVLPGWVRVSNPRYSFGSGSAMDDGSPRAAHSGSQIVYAANVDRYILTGMPYFSANGDSSGNLYAFNRATNTWSSLAAAPSAYGDGGYFHGGAGYDTVTGYVWMASTTSSSGSVSRYEPLTNRHTLYAIRNAQGYNGTAAIAPARRAMLYLNGNATGSDGSFVWLDLDNPGAGWRPPAAVSGTGIMSQGAGFVWHQASGAFLGWDSGASLYKLVPPSNLVTGTWVWSRVNAASLNLVTPTSRMSNGTYGRFNVVENLGGSGRDCLVLINSATEATFVFKLPAGGV